MKNKRKKTMIVSSIFVIIIGIGIGFYIFKKKFFEDKIISNENNNQNMIYNKNDTFLKDIDTESVVFNNIECSYNGKVSLISYTIENKTDKQLHLNKYEILVKNEKDEVLTNIIPNLDIDIDAKDILNITNEINIDLTNAHSMEFVNIEIIDKTKQ